jgi:cell division protein ZapA
MTAEGEGAPARESRRVEITLLGQTLTLRTEESPDYLRSLAAYLENRVQTLRQSGVNDPGRALMLAALDITDELFRAREDKTRQDGDVDTRLSALVEILDRLAPGTPPSRA